MYRNRYQRLSDFISYKIKSCVHSIVLVLWNKGEEGLLYIYLLHVIQSNKFWTQFQILNVFYLIFHILTHVLAGLSGILHYCKLSGYRKISFVQIYQMFLHFPIFITRFYFCNKFYQFVSLYLTNMRSDNMLYLYSKCMVGVHCYMSGFTFERFWRYILSYILLLVNLLFVICLPQ